MKVNVNFINGAFVEIISAVAKEYYVQFIDSETGQIMHDGIIRNNMWIKCAYAYYIKYKISIIDNDTKKLVFTHDMDLRGKRVYIWFDSKSLGDNISWIPMVDEFAKKHECEVVCSTFFNQLFEKTYTNIKFVPNGTEVHKLYAMYQIGCSDNDSFKNKENWRLLSNQQICGSILGINEKNTINPNLKLNGVRTLNEKYVCITTISTSQCKFWNNPTGWNDVVKYLVNCGYKVVILQTSKPDIQLSENVIHPDTSNIDVLVSYIQHCDFFIGLGSGLSWLAWALSIPTILISGFSLPKSEFYTPYRIINTNVCHGCWNDPRFPFDRGDWNWCPKQKGTAREFECSKHITSEDVINTIKRLVNENYN